MKLYRDSAAGFTIVYPAKWVKFSARLAFGPQVPDGAAMAVGDPKGGTTGDVPVDYIAFMAQSDPQAGGDAGQESATEEMVVSGLRKAGTQWGASLPAQADFHVVEPAKGIKVRGLVAAEITFRMITAEGQAVLMTVVEAGNDTHLCMLVLTCEEGQRQKYKPIFDQTLGSLALTGAH